MDSFLQIAKRCYNIKSPNASFFLMDTTPKIYISVNVNQSDFLSSCCKHWAAK